jgi:hypothetical protein
MEQKETRQWYGSVCAGVLTSRWPFGRMITCSDHIELKSLLGRFVLSQDEVQSIEYAKLFPWLWMGIRICHNHRDYPQRLMFNPIAFWRRRYILGHLRTLGYKVA